MQPCRLLLIGLLLAIVVPPAPAGIFFGKRAKVNPAERVPALLVTVKTDPDDGKRAAAAEELREYDPVSFPAIVPILIDVLAHDAKPGVRVEAAQSLSRIQPISQEVGLALEQAAEKDSALRVRVQARTALWHYHLNGYHSPGKDAAAAPRPDGIRTDEPPLAFPAPTTPSPVAGKTSSLSNWPPASKAVSPAPLVPAASPPPVLVPAQPPAFATPPTSRPTDDGPDLSPPQ